MIQKFLFHSLVKFNKFLFIHITFNINDSFHINELLQYLFLSHEGDPLYYKVYYIKCNWLNILLNSINENHNVLCL